LAPSLPHERSNINNDELLGTIWEHSRKKTEGKGFFSIWHLALGITLIIIIMPHPS